MTQTSVVNPRVHEAPSNAATLARRSPRRAWFWTSAVALLGVALLLRIWHLDNIAGFNGDEAWSGIQALRLLHGQDIEWRTPNGNPINGFFLVPLVGLHALFPPSLVLLRAVSLASGLLALVVNYLLCRRAFDERTAVISTLLLALLPIDIAYSRFAWDASQSLLATLFVLYLPLVGLREHGDGRLISGAAMIACAAAVLIHPTNVFAVALLVVPAASARRRRMLQIVRHAAIPAKTWTLAALVAGSACTGYLAWQWAPLFVSRAHGPAELLAFGVRYLQLFSGTTVYRFISGAGLDTAEAGWFAHTTLPFDLAFGVVALAGLFGAWCRVARGPAVIDRSLVIGWFTMLLGFFVVAGPAAVAPHAERYGICLIAPGALVLARGLTWWIERPEPAGSEFAVTLALVAWMWPASFCLNYFECFFETGGASHPAFRTAAIEPKAMALGYIRTHQPADRPADVVCHEWWSDRPLAYLAAGDPKVRVLTWDAWRRREAGEENRREGDTWFVEFVDSAGEREVLAGLQAAGLTAERYTICDYAGRPVIAVVGPAENFSQNY